uniref:Ovule protein n=1 Tax=Haemonchus placei TaxID=6290 RepID=A0A0N4WCY3_HAEPC
LSDDTREMNAILIPWHSMSLFSIDFLFLKTFLRQAFPLLDSSSQVTKWSGNGKASALQHRCTIATKSSL